MSDSKTVWYYKPGYLASTPRATSYTSLFLLGLPTLACSLGRHSSHSRLEKFLISLGFTVITLGKYFLLNYWNFKRTCQKPRRWFTTQMAREVLEQNKTDRNWPTFFLSVYGLEIFHLNFCQLSIRCCFKIERHSYVCNSLIPRLISRVSRIGSSRFPAIFVV